jgi:hypothetical protein
MQPANQGPYLHRQAAALWAKERTIAVGLPLENAPAPIRPENELGPSRIVVLVQVAWVGTHRELDETLKSRIGRDPLNITERRIDLAALATSLAQPCAANAQRLILTHGTTTPEGRRTGEDCGLCKRRSTKGNLSGFGFVLRQASIIRGFDLHQSDWGSG